jgi:hypothetical protein
LGRSESKEESAAAIDWEVNGVITHPASFDGTGDADDTQNKIWEAARGEG